VRPIQSNHRSFQCNKKARAFEKAYALSQEGAIGPIFEGDMPRKKMTPKSGAVSGTIALNPVKLE
jgi:hypothetical protein